MSVPIVSHPMLYTLKTSIDNGIIDYISAQKGVKVPPMIQASHSPYPNPPDRLVWTISMVPTVGLFYFCLTPLITFVTLLTEVVKEKELWLR